MQKKCFGNGKIKALICSLLYNHEGQEDHEDLADKAL